MHPGTAIYKLAEPAEHLYLLKKGTVKIEAGYDLQELVKIPIVSCVNRTRINDVLIRTGARHMGSAEDNKENFEGNQVGA